MDVFEKLLKEYDDAERQRGLRAMESDTRLRALKTPVECTECVCHELESGGGCDCQCHQVK